MRLRLPKWLRRSEGPSAPAPLPPVEATRLHNAVTRVEQPVQSREPLGRVVKADKVADFAQPARRGGYVAHAMPKQLRQMREAQERGKPQV